MVMVTLPFWIVFAIFSPALFLFLFVGIRSGMKPAIKAKAPVSQYHISARPINSPYKPFQS